MSTAGGGGLVFAETLNLHADKIIIRDPSFQIPPYWDRIAGFDHGKTNLTAALVTAVDEFLASAREPAGWTLLLHGRNSAWRPVTIGVGTECGFLPLRRDFFSKNGSGASSKEAPELANLL